MTEEREEAWAGLGRREAEVLDFVARFGVVPRDAVAARVGTGRSTTVARERRLREAGLLTVEKPLCGEPFLLATRLGLEASGHGDLFPAKIALPRLAHFSAVAHLAVTLEAEGRRLLSERELLAHERAMGERIFSVTLAKGSHHRPDLILLPPDHPLASPYAGASSAAPHSRADEPEAGPETDLPASIGHPRTRKREQSISDSFLLPREQRRWPPGAGDRGAAPPPAPIEVELTPKGSERLDAIVAAYREAVEAGRFSSVRYLCSDEALPVVRRSVDRTGSGAAVAVAPLPSDL